MSTIDIIMAIFTIIIMLPFLFLAVYFWVVVFPWRDVIDDIKKGKLF